MAMFSLFCFHVIFTPIVGLTCIQSQQQVEEVNVERKLDNDNRLITLEECQSWYNVPPEEADEYGWRSLVTIEDPTEVSPDEKHAVHMAMLKTVTPFGLRLAAELITAPSQPDSNALGLFPGDRTNTISILPEFATPELLSSIRKTIQRKCPGWRIVLVGGTDEFKIFIDSTSFGFVEGARGKTLDESLSNVVRIESKWIDSTKGESDRQLEIVKTALAKHLTESKPPTPKIIATFDNYEGDKGWCIVWVFHTGKKEHDFQLSPEQDSSSRAFAVGSDGNLCEYYELDPKNRLGVINETFFNKSQGFEKTVKLIESKPKNEKSSKKSN